MPQDLAKAAEHYRRAAQQGVVMAQYHLGFMYGQGEGVEQDYVQAYVWLSLAAAQGYETGQEYRDIVVGRLSEVQIEEARRLTGEYYQRYVVPFR